MCIAMCSYVLCNILAPKPSCELYNGKICFAKGVIGKDYVFVNTTDNDRDQMFWETALIGFNSSLVNTVQRQDADESCLDKILSLMCFYTFPACDYGNNVSTPRKVCMYVCMYVNLTGRSWITILA